MADDRKSIKFTDKKGIGKLNLKGTRDLHFYQINQIKRVRLVRRADCIYVQFCIDVNRKESTEPSGNTISLDVGLKEYYTDSNGVMVKNPRFLRKGEKVLFGWINPIRASDIVSGCIGIISSQNESKAVPCPYNIILGMDTPRALDSIS